MKCRTIALAVTGLFLQPVLTLAAALPLENFGTLAVFLAATGIMIFGLLTGVAVLVGQSFGRRSGYPQAQPGSRQPHLAPRQLVPDSLPEYQEVC